MSAKGSDLLQRTSGVRYARSGGQSVAYRVIESPREVPRDVLLVIAGTMSMEAWFDDPVAVRLVEGLNDLGRLVMFDRCGIGLSDPPLDWDAPAFAGWLHDIDAVVAAAGLVEPVVVSGVSGALVSLTYCLRHPDGVAALVLHEPSWTGRAGPDIVRAQIEGEVDSIALWIPSRADEPGFREWFTNAGRSGASPRLAARAYPTPNEHEQREIEAAASGAAFPTLILRRPAVPYGLSPKRSEDPFLALVAGAVRVDIPGRDTLSFGGEVDALLAEVHLFVAGEHRPLRPERTLAAILYADVVASTERAVRVGDAHWKRLLDRHDATAHACVHRRGGTVVKTMGDGILATFPSATDAILAARELRGALLGDGLQLRVGIHVGEIDARGSDVSGLAVTIASRVMDLAVPGEIVASEAVPRVVSGSGVAFRELGPKQLKGIAEPWRLYAVDEPPAPASPIEGSRS